MEKSIYSENQKALLKLLKRVREEAGLTQIQLAEKLGVGQAIISNYERGERRLDILELRQVCKAIGLPLPEFTRRLDEELGD